MKKIYQTFLHRTSYTKNLSRNSKSSNELNRNKNVFITTFLIFVFANISFAQTTLINPATDGGFEVGSTFAANGWTNSSSANNPWFLGTGGTAAAGAPISGNRAFVSNTVGASTNYDVTLPCVNYFYKDITVPAGETKIVLSFNSLSQGETTWDMWQVFTAPTTIIPVGQAAHPGSGVTLVPASITGATYVGTSNVGNVIPANSVQNITLSLLPSLAGTTFRLIFAWKSDTSTGAQPPSSIDNISLVSSLPGNATATALGGLWSSPATWSSGIVPAADNVTIPLGSVVTIDQAISQNSINVNGILQWGASSVPLSVTGNLTIGSTGKFFPHNNAAAPVGQTLNVGGNFTNNGYANLACASTFLNFNGSQVGGSTSQNFDGTGTFEGNGTSGFVRTLFFQSNGTLNIGTTQNLITTSLANTAGTLNTGGKLAVDNTIQLFGQPYNLQVTNLVVPVMGAGYALSPVIFGASVSPFVLSGSATINTRYFFGNEVYLATTAGSFDGAITPSHTSGIVTNGTVPLLWIGNLGILGNPFVVTAVTLGTQYFYGNNLYVCTVAGIPLAAAPPIHTTGAVASGTATFLYVGTAAKTTVNYDSVTQTVRSLNLTNAGNGYSSSPTAVFSSVTGGTPTTAATATTLVNTLVNGPANSSLQKSGIASISGGLTINSDQGAIASSGVGNVSVPTGGNNYTVPPTIGFAGPTAVNLVTAQGSGYTAAPTVTVTGGTLISGAALATSNFTITVAQGKVVSVYLNGATSSIYSVPPTLAITGVGTGATLAFPSGCWPTATPIIGSNGQITNFTVTNAGFGYVLAPIAGIGNLSGTANGGTFTTAAGTPTVRIALYALGIGFFTPAPSNVVNVEGVEVPTNRKITAGLTINSSLGANFTNDLKLIAVAPIALTNGVINMGTKTLSFENPTYAGIAGTATSNIINGQIKFNSIGGSVTRTFPFDAPIIVNTGTGSLATGSSITNITASRPATPTGTVSPAGAPTGSRAIRLVTGTGEVYGTLPTVQVGYNAIDGLVSDNPSLSLSQSAALTGPWTVRSAAGAAGALPATGNRITATVAPGPIVPTGDDYFAFTTTFVAYVSAQTGDWNTGSTWVGGVVPPVSCENVIINPNHIVTSSTAGNVCKTLSISAAGELKVTGGDLTVGCTLNNNSLSNNGTLTISGGILNVNGNIDNSSTASIFNQSGGTVKIDGNSGVTATSVATGIPLFNSISNLVNLTGGLLLFVDPHAGTATENTLKFNNGTAVASSLATSPLHTTQFGDGISTDAGGSVNGFRVDPWTGTAYLSLGKIVLNGGTGVNRNLTAAYQLTANGNVDVLSNNITVSSLILGGNLTVNSGGTLVNTVGLATALITSNTSTTLTFAPITNAQSITNNGIISNLATSPTANLSSLTVNNLSVSGVTLNVPLSISGTLTLTAGKVNTTATNLLTLGTATAAGILSGGSATSYIDGPFARTFATRASAATYDQTTLYPVGRGAVYQPITIAPTTTGVAQIKAEAFTTNAGTFVNPIVSISPKRWETSVITGALNLTNAFVQLGGLTTTVNDVILKSSSASGQYDIITPSTTVAATTLTSATAMLAGDINFLSFGTKCTTPGAPTGNATQTFCEGATVANLTTTTGSSILWYDAATAGNLVTPTTLLVSGNYYASQTVAGGCESTARLAVVVTVNPLLTPTFTAVPAICSGDTLSALPLTSNNGVTGTWAPALVNTNTTSSPVTTTYTFTPTSGQCVNPTFTTLSITVNPLTNTNTTIAACTSYTWSVNGSTYTTSGTYTSTVGCATQTLILTINNCDIQYANIQFPGTSSICSGASETFYAQVYKSGVTEAAGQGAGITAWIAYNTSNTDPSTWSTSSWALAIFNVQVGNNDEYQITLSGLPTGTYYVASRFQFTGGAFYYGGYTSSGGGAWGGSNVSAVLTVNAPVLAPTGAATQDACSPTTLAQFVVSGINLKWYATNSSTAVLPLSTTVVFNQIYYVSQTIGTCEGPRFAVTASGPCLGTNGFDDAKFSYYPNPVTVVLNLTYSSEISKLQIINILGQEVITKLVNATEVQVNMENLPAGTYLVKVTSDSLVKILKVIKQ